MSDYEHALAMQTKPRLIKEIGRLREDIDGLDAMEIEVRRLREALESIASDPDQVYVGPYLYHKGRADGLRCAGAVARAVLHTADESGPQSEGGGDEN